MIPIHWGGAAYLEGQTQNLKIGTPDATLRDHPRDAGEKLLRARVGRRVELSYDIVRGKPSGFAIRKNIWRSSTQIIFCSIRRTPWYPEMPRTGDIDAIFDWRALPKNMPILTSFGINERVMRVRAPWIRVVNGLFAGGNFRISEDRKNGTTLVLAARGTWKFSDADALETIRRVLDEENQFWHATPMPYFLVTLAPFDDRSGDNDGSGFTSAYMLFLSHEDTMDPERIRLMAHEMFHHWNPDSMGTRTGDDVAAWFAQGFTVYYAGVIPLRSGLTSYEEYLEYVNHSLRRYELSPLREMKQADWKGISYSSGTGYELSYVRGAAVALWANAAIRARSGGKSSLDNVMFDLVKQSQPANPPADFTEERVIAAFARYLSRQRWRNCAAW